MPWVDAQVTASATSDAVLDSSSALNGSESGAVAAAVAEEDEGEGIAKDDVVADEDRSPLLPPPPSLRLPGAARKEDAGGQAATLRASDEVQNALGPGRAPRRIARNGRKSERESFFLSLLSRLWRNGLSHFFSLSPPLFLSTVFSVVCFLRRRKNGGSARPRHPLAPRSGRKYSFSPAGDRGIGRSRRAAACIKRSIETKKRKTHSGRRPRVVVCRCRRRRLQSACCPLQGLWFAPFGRPSGPAGRVRHVSCSSNWGRRGGTRRRPGNGNGQCEREQQERSRRSQRRAIEVDSFFFDFGCSLRRPLARRGAGARGGPGPARVVHPRPQPGELGRRSVSRKKERVGTREGIGKRKGREREREH